MSDDGDEISSLFEHLGRYVRDEDPDERIGNGKCLCVSYIVFPFYFYFWLLNLNRSFFALFYFFIY